MHVHAQGVHVGQALFRRPTGLGGQAAAPVADDGDFPAPGVLLAAQAVPVAAVGRGASRSIGE